MCISRYMALTAALHLSLLGAPAVARSDPPKEGQAGVSEARLASSRSRFGIPNREEVERLADAEVEKAGVLSRAQMRKGLTAALKHLETSARLYRSVNEPDKAADSYLRASEMYITMGGYEEARRLLQLTQKLSRDNLALQCQARTLLARSYVATGPVPVADRYSAQALPLCENINPAAQAEALEIRGEVLDSLGDHTASTADLRRAYELFASVNDDNGQAQALLMLAYSAFFTDGQHTEGLATAREALNLWERAGNRDGLARVRSALGIFAITTGEFETAECNYQMAQSLFHEVGDRDNEASILNGLGFVHRELGDWRQSLDYYRNATAEFTSVHDLVGAYEALTNTGKALIALQDYKRLLAVDSEGLSVARRAGDPVLIAASLADMADAYAIKGNSQRAESSYRQALQAYQAQNHIYGESDVLIRLARLQTRQGAYPQAIASLNLAKELKEKTGQIEEIAKVQYELAWIYCRLNRLDEARATIEQTIETIENQRLTISKFDSRATYFASVHKYYALYIHILMRQRSESDQATVAKAFNASERSKVRSLLDLLTASYRDAPCKDLLQRQMDSTVPADAVATPNSLPAATLTLEEVQAEIDDNETVLLEYALGSERSYVWAIDRHHASAYELPRSDQISPLVRRFLDTLVPPQYRAGEGASEYQIRARKQKRDHDLFAGQLSQLLLGPVDLKRAKHILIVPDGCLHSVPFVALPLPQPRTAKLIATRYQVDLLPSASVIVTLRRERERRPPPTATAFILADPVFEPDDPRIGTSHRIAERQKMEEPSSLVRAIRDTPGSQYIVRLPASRAEADAIARVLGARDPQGVHLAVDFDASRNFVLQDGLARYRLIHFATHGVMDARRPEMSGLVLSLIDRSGRSQDGYLRMGDISKLKLSADLVVLSSCESALGKDLESEGVIGLPRAFLYAGAKTVIASLWKVDDEATARLMSSLYARIGRGEGPSAALRGAQLEVMGDERWADPYYWAGFVAQGEYKSR